MARRVELWAKVNAVLPLGRRRAREEAMTWLARLERGLRESEGPELLAWLRRPAHRALITKAAAEWHGPEILAVLGAIFPLDPRLAQPPQGRSPRMVAAMALICAGVTATPLVLINRYVPGNLWEVLGDIYTTRPGNTRQIALADGTRVELNGGTRIAVAYAEHVRSVLVSQGEAIFTVARERHRPFHVRAAGRDFDTQSSTFDVRVGAAQHMDLVVLAGTVTAFPPPPRRRADEAPRDAGTPPVSSTPMLVSALQALAIDADTQRGSALSEQDLRTQLAWRPGK